MSGDIEDFLRRAAERRKQQQGRKGPSSGPPLQRPNVPPPRPPQPIVRQLEVVDAEIIEAEPVTGDDVAADVARHLDNRDFAERTSHLGQGVRNEAMSIQARVEKDLGQGPLTRKKKKAVQGTNQDFHAPAEKTTDIAAIVQVAQGNDLAKDIVALIRNPQTLRQAIILSDIFARPEDRW